ncbi:unnamed protein product [Cunninghamella echinulata]
MYPFLPFTLYPTSDTSCQTLSPTSSPDNQGCKLLDGFAILVQMALASSALGVLFYKRSIERPQRPVQIWLLNVGKQFIGAAVIHSLNLIVSYLVGRPKNGPPSNLCVWYMLNVFVDCTLGIFILWCWLRGIQWFLGTVCHMTYVKTGNYGPPPLKRRIVPWIKQTLIFITAEGLMKLCVFGIFKLCPFLFRFGEWALSWTKGNYRYQVLFVMLIFPLLMNGMQFWVVDTIIKMTPKINNNSFDQIEEIVENEQQLPINDDERTPLLNNSS